VTHPKGARAAAFLAFTLTLAAMLGNGRAIGSGDTTAMERTAGSLVEQGTVVLADDGAADPFTRKAAWGRVSIYPVVPALLAAPFFLLCRFLFDLNPAGLQAAGKLAAACLSACATALLARSFATRTSPGRALGAALLFGLGTSVFSTSQALWQHPAVLLFMVVALGALERLDTLDPGDRLKPGLVAAASLSLAAAARPAAIPMVATLFFFLLIRARAQSALLLAAAAIPAAGVALYNATFFGAPWRFGPVGAEGRFFAALPESIAGLLVSPARGLLVFTPVALVALWGLRAQTRTSALARALAGAAAVHFLFIAAWNEWHGGESFGPRLLTDLLPALFFFLPEGLAAWPKAGVLLGGVSVAIQLLGGWTYDYRWERLHQRGLEFDAALWSWTDSPIAFALREGVMIQGTPDLGARRVRLHVRRSTPFGPAGSIIEATPSGLRISGAPLVRDVRLERGARSGPGGIALSHPGDALAFRAGSEATRSLRLIGSLEGVLRLETPSGATSVPASGAFDLAFPLALAPGEDVFVRAETGLLRLARVEARSDLSP
jgi:hypothetical protein